MRTMSLVLALIFALIIGGCGPKAVSSGTRTRASEKLKALQAKVDSLWERSYEKSEALQSQADALRAILGNMNVAVAPEPSADVSDGLFMGHVIQIEPGTPTPTFVIDFVTADMMPGLSKEQRERSSWSDYFGWNKTRHPQRLRIYDSAELAAGGARFLPMSPKGFVHEWKTNSSSADLNYYIAIRDREVVALWPWVR